MIYFTKFGGGPGSGVSKNNTKKISLPLSSKTSLHKRKKLKKKLGPPKTKTINISDISHVGQEKYVPKKLKWFVNNYDKWKDKPIDVFWDADNSSYHVMDGHHRFLALRKLSKKNHKAHVYQ